MKFIKMLLGLESKKDSTIARKQKVAKVQSKGASSKIYGVYRGKVAISEARNEQEKKRLEEGYLKVLTELEAY